MRKFVDWLLSFASPIAVAAADREPMKITDVALAEATAAYGAPLKAYTVPKAPPFVPAGIAMDAGNSQLTDLYGWANGGAFGEGLGFLGYPYLAELSQRPEYRRVSEIWAAEATRKWIKLSGNEERVKKLEKVMEAFKVRALFREACEHDGFFGRAQIFIDLGDRARGELAKPLAICKEKIPKGGLKGLKVVEPFWSYPGPYESARPTAQDFYRPKTWQIMSDTIDTSRLLSFVGREVPDLLKPAYMFGGLSLSQMIKPYVDNWLRARQSVSDLMAAFSTMVLSTDMSTILAGGGADTLVKRAELFNKTRDNRGLMTVNKETEDLTNVSTPLGTLDKLQSQAQEHIASVSGIPLVKLLGVTPSGLNASSDGEIKTFYDTIAAYQEGAFRGPLETVIAILQLHEFGDIDEDITFEFLDLWELDESAKAVNRKSDGDVDVAYVGAGIVSPEEVRARIVEDEESPYFGLDLADEAPELPAAATAEEMTEGLEDDPDPFDGANDADWEESKHKRADNGQFGSGGGSSREIPRRASGEEWRAFMQQKVGKGWTVVPRQTARMTERGEVAVSPKRYRALEEEFLKEQSTSKSGKPEAPVGERDVKGFKAAREAHPDDRELEYIEEEIKRYSKLDDLRRELSGGEKDEGSFSSSRYRKEANEIGLHPLSEKEINERFEQLEQMTASALERLGSATKRSGPLIDPTTVASLPAPAAVSNPFTSYEDAERVGAQSREMFAGQLTKLANALGLKSDVARPDRIPGNHKGGLVFLAANKSEARSTEKVDKEYDGDWSQLRDYVRASVAFDTMDDLRRALAALPAAGIEFAAKPKDKFANPTSVGYSDVNTLVRLPNGGVAELQFHLKAMLAAKGEAHDLYAEQQKLTRKNGSDVPNDKWSADDAHDFNALEAQQKAIYGRVNRS